MRAGAHTCAQVCLRLCIRQRDECKERRGEGAWRGLGRTEGEKSRGSGGQKQLRYREEASPTHFSSSKKPSPLSFCILSFLLFPPCRSALSIPALLSPCCCSACCRAVIALPAIAVFSLLTACCFAFTTCITALLFPTLFSGGCPSIERLFFFCCCFVLSLLLFAVGFPDVGK